MIVEFDGPLVAPCSSKASRVILYKAGLMFLLSQLYEPWASTMLLVFHVHCPLACRVLLTKRRTVLRYLSEALNVMGTFPEKVAPLVGEEMVVFGGIVRSDSTL